MSTSRGHSRAQLRKAHAHLRSEYHAAQPRRLLAGQTVDRSEPPEKIHGVDADDGAVGELVERAGTAQLERIKDAPVLRLRDRLLPLRGGVGEEPCAPPWRNSMVIDPSLTIWEMVLAQVNGGGGGANSWAWTTWAPRARR